MKNKTVWDLVNEFKGIYPTHRRIDSEFIGVMFNEKEFTALVVEMEINFGKSQCYVSYKENFEGITTDRLIPIAESKPVYTQAMHDAGVLPSTGMECLINFPDIDNVWYKYTIDFMGKHSFIASCKDVDERFGHVEDVYFKPFVELIDGECYQFEIVRSGGIVKGFYEHEDETFNYVNGDIKSKYCTNIKQLTVKEG